MTRYPFPFLQQLEDLGDQYLLKRLPALPDQVREVIALIVPWLVILGVIFSVPTFAAFLGINWFGGMGAMSVSYRFVNVVFTTLTFVAVIFQAIAIPGLLRRDRSGWQWLFIASLISLVASLFSITPFFSILFVVIGFYLLFQIKPLFR